VSVGVSGTCGREAKAYWAANGRACTRMGSGTAQHFGCRRVFQPPGPRGAGTKRASGINSRRRDQTFRCHALGKTNPFDRACGQDEVTDLRVLCILVQRRRLFRQNEPAGRDEDGRIS